MHNGLVPTKLQIAERLVWSHLEMSKSTLVLLIDLVVKHCSSILLFINFYIEIVTLLRTLLL